MTYRCSVCGERHDDLPDMVMDKPDMWFGIREEERETRVQITTDTCIIDEEDFFIRGVIEIPIINSDRRFGFGVWISQRKENFLTYLDNLDSAEIGPFFGWLCNRIDFYEEDTLFLKTMAHFRGASLRPSIELDDTDHPLSIDQGEGMALEKAWKIIHFYGIGEDAVS